MDYSKYGLTKTNKTKSDYKKGIVTDGTNFYKIDNFERQQKDGESDTDQGDVFSSSLEKDSGKDFSTFNTIHDVEGALQALNKDEVEDKDYGGDQDNIELSERLATARARTTQYEEDRVSGQMAKDLYNSDENPSSGFLERYKMKLGKRLENGNYTSSTNSSKVASGQNDVSVDAAQYSRTGKDNRKGY